MKFGSILRDCREYAGFSQEKIAEKLQRSRSCISKLENDKKILDAETLIKWTQVTSAPDVLVALLHGVDITTVAQNISQFLGGCILWFF